MADKRTPSGTTYVALLRGVNIGANKRVAMADLRRVAEGLGHEDVRTYVNSGNLLFRSSAKDTARLGSALSRAIASELGVEAPVIVRSAAELAKEAKANPFPHEKEPKWVHVIFLEQKPDRAALAAARAAQRTAEEKGSPDQVKIIGRAVYLHTPAGFGTSVLAPLLAKSATASGTARNWSTVTKLVEMSATEP